MATQFHSQHSELLRNERQKLHTFPTTIFYHKTTTDKICLTDGIEYLQLMALLTVFLTELLTWARITEILVFQKSRYRRCGECKDKFVSYDCERFTLFWCENGWPELSVFINQCVEVDNDLLKETAMLILANLLEQSTNVATRDESTFILEMLLGLLIHKPLDDRRSCYADIRIASTKYYLNALVVLMIHDM
ncbi:hypothetical protein Tco_0005267 [Tanacetum coccineum]